MTVAETLDRWHLHARKQWWLHDFTALTRVLLAIGFVPPGLVKVFGEPFTQGGPDTPIGLFFTAFFQAEGYYAFVGAAQVLAGLILLWPRTATLGALIYLPIIANIFVITATLGFRGTWLVTGLMTLATVYLLAWDYHRLRALLPFAETEVENGMPQVRGRLRWTPAGLALGGGVFLLVTRGLMSPSLLWLPLVLLPLGGFADLAILVAARRERLSRS